MEKQDYLNQHDDQMESFILFGMSTEMFAVDINSIIEILEVPKITRLPRTPAYIAGIISLRGKALPVIDTRKKFGLPEISLTVDSAIIVIEINQNGRKTRFGALVDGVHEVIDVPISTIGAFNAIQTQFSLEFIKGVIQSDEKFVLLLDTEKIFSNQEVQEIAETEGEVETPAEEEYQRLSA